MGLSIGIVGLPNVGKSTLFNALLRREIAKVAEYPFTTIKPHEGIALIDDERLNKLVDLLKPQTIVPPSVNFVDIAGLVKGASKGEGLGNEFLGHIREVDAILQVVRAFENNLAAHPLGQVDPERDIEIVNTELILKDLETVSKLEEKEKDASIKALLSKVKNFLNQGKMVKDLELSLSEKEILQAFQLLTNKPMFYVLNVSEKGLEKGKVIERLGDKDFLIVCAQLEAEISVLSPSEQKEYLMMAGISSFSLEKIIRKAYEILELITFFTIKGGKEIRAYPIKKGTTAWEAAGLVHTEMQKGFIKAEVIGVEELLKCGSWQKAQEKGKIRVEGHDYSIQDGEILEFKFRI